MEQDDALPEVKPVDGLDGVTVASAAAGQSVSGCIDAEGSPYVWGMGTTNQLAKGEDDDSDEALPKKIAQTKAFNNQRVLQLEFGGQHVAMLCQAK